jgi:hypothetical protein
MEIVDGQIKLVKWYADKDGNNIYEVYQSERLEKLIEEVTGNVESDIPPTSGQQRSAITTRG